MEKRPYPPEQHGPEKQFRRVRRSSYGQQLQEKQELAYVYNVRERQMRRYCLRAARMPGLTGETLLSLLERRLDSLVYRAGFAPTPWSARQLVSHRHILVDGRTVNVGSYTVKPGQRISLKPKMQQNPQVLDWIEDRASPPRYLDVDLRDFTATLAQMPAREQIPVPVNEQLVVEYYSRRT